MLNGFRDRNLPGHASLQLSHFRYLSPKLIQWGSSLAPLLQHLGKVPTKSFPSVPNALSLFFGVLRALLLLIEEDDNGGTGIKQKMRSPDGFRAVESWLWI